jgi:GT2 family glycosyltransferase
MIEIGALLDTRESRTERTGHMTVGKTMRGDPAEADEIVLSVIIATYNARDVVAGCLRSIEANPPSARHEVIVVDDASADDTAEMVRQLFPRVRLLRNEVNCHYAASANRALDCARGEFVLLLNNDTLVRPQALDRMIAFLREHPQAGAVGCKLLNEDGSLQWTVKALPNLSSGFFGAGSIITRRFPNNPLSRRHLLHLGRDMTSAFAAGYVSGAAVMHPRRVVKEVGALDQRFFYHVDADYCKRMADLGYQSFYLPTAEIVHLAHKGGSMGSLRRRFRSIVEFHKGGYLYYRKHLRRSAWTPMQLVVVLGLCARFLLSVAAQTGSELATLATLPRRQVAGSADRE